ncbi:uncharacterized protein LOC135489653 [Lineus longissimus]|uniref:uncharacterized protein LOC135489653 n=1 Tax=Lineus longissimus TaxID=88925 RepID=UPI002B4F927F
MSQELERGKQGADEASAILAQFTIKQSKRNNKLSIMTWGVTNSEKPGAQRPVSGAVPVIVERREPQIPYASNKAYIAGIAKVIGGVLCFIFGLLQCYALARTHLIGKVPCGYGEICGLIFIVTGSVAINASQRKTPNRIAASLGLSFISIMVSAGIWIWMIYFAATKTHFLKRHFYGGYHRHHGHHGHGSGSHEGYGGSGSHEGHRGSGSHEEHRGSGESGRGSHEQNGTLERHERSIFSNRNDIGTLLPIVYLATTVFIFVMLFAMFWVAILQAVVCYRACKSSNKYRQMDDDKTFIVPFKTKEKMMTDAEEVPKKKKELPAEKEEEAEKKDGLPDIQKDNFFV